jgi:hypothetical protein
MDKVFKIKRDGTQGRRMPQADFHAMTSPRTVSELMHSLEHYTANPAEVRALYPWADRFVLGIPLPSWQRPVVWTIDQQIKLVQSLWLELDVGSYLVNAWDEFEPGDEAIYKPNAGVLLDGQQRLTALQNYLLNVFPVPDAEGIPCYWSDLSCVEQRKFGSRTFNRATINSGDEVLLRKVYDIRAFAGVRHSDDQRASN